MKNISKKPNSYFIRKIAHSKSPSVLQDFSKHLDCQIQKVKSMNRNNKQPKKLNESFGHNRFPSIHHNSNGKISLYNKLSQIQNKINNLQKNSQSFNSTKQRIVFDQSFYDEDKQNLYPGNSFLSIPKKRPPHRLPPVQQPMLYPNFIPFQMPFYQPINGLNGFNSFNGINPNQFNPQMSSRGNNNQKQDTQRQEIPSISAPRKKFLKRRFKVIAKAVLFIFLYKNYSKTISYHKFLIKLAMDQQFKDHDGFQQQLFQECTKLNLYEIFYQICKLEQSKQENKKFEYKVNFQGQKIQINLKASLKFINKFLQHVKQVIYENQFPELYNVVKHFLDRQFPLQNMLLKQQLQALAYNQNGTFNNQPQVQKMLILSYFFVKIIIYKFLFKKRVFKILQKAFQKKNKQKKFIVLYGKKLLITLVLFYSNINAIFFNNLIKRDNNFNEIPSFLIPKPMQQLQYQIKINDQIDQYKDDHLIKKINCDSQLSNVFIENFQDSWILIKDIIKKIHNRAKLQKIQQLKQIKEDILNKPFQIDDIQKKIAQKKQQENKQNNKFKSTKKTSSEKCQSKSSSAKTNSQKQIPKKDKKKKKNKK